MGYYNVLNPSPQDLEDAIKDRYEKEDYYYKALAESQEKLYNMMMENAQEETLIETYPTLIYTVQGNGVMTLYLKIDVKCLKNKLCPEFGEPYEAIRMLELPSDNIGWRLRDYESEIQDKNRTICYSQFTLDYINERLNAESIEVWTLDIEEAKRISQERYAEYFPIGNAYDVVSYWDDCDRKVIKSQLLRSEANKLCHDLNHARKAGSLYSYTVEIHR